MTKVGITALVLLLSLVAPSQAGARRPQPDAESSGFFRVAVRSIRPRPWDSAAGRMPEVRITALRFVGDQPSQEDEFIELTNLGSLPLDLTDALIEVSIAFAHSQLVARLPAGFVLDPAVNPVCRIYTGAVPAEEGCGLSLAAADLWPDQRGSITLRFVEGAGRVLDSVSYAADPARQRHDGDNLTGVRLAPPATAEVAPAGPDCDPVDAWRPGRWTGTFIGMVESQWTAEVSGGRRDDRLEGEWQADMRLRGGLEVHVGTDSVSKGSRIEGAAGALWWSRRAGSRDDGVRNETVSWGHLNGGAILPASISEGAIDGSIEWRGASWRQAPGAVFGFYTNIIEPGRGVVLHGDGFIGTREAGSFLFTVTSISCEKVSGEFDASQLWRSLSPGLEPLGTTATFTLTRR